MKPIEPGCLAVVIRSKVESRIGTTVTVIGRTPKDRLLMEADGSFHSSLGCWDVDPGYLADNGLYWSARESSLLRIDGGEDESVEEQQEEEDAHA